MRRYDLPPDTPGFAEAQAAMAARSRPAADVPGAMFDLAYGSDPRQRLDVFPAGPDAPVLVFLRGGYWRVGAKEDRWFPALAWGPRGVSWVVPNYRLAPKGTLREIVDDANAVLAWLVARGQACGLNATDLHLVGNSAGAHLAAMAAIGPTGAAVKSLTLLSGLYDLEPLLAEEANDWLQLDPATARALSPIHHLPPVSVPVSVLCGADETPAFRVQSKRYADALRAQGNSVDHVESPGKNHMQIVLECGDPGTPVFDAITRQIDRRAGPRRALK